MLQCNQMQLKAHASGWRYFHESGLKEFAIMKIAIVSDTHSRRETVQAALDLIAARQVELILHCGDIEDAETVALFPGNTHFVFGNCDMDHARHQGRGGRDRCRGARAFWQPAIGRRAIAFLHGDDKRIYCSISNSRTRSISSFTATPTRLPNTAPEGRASSIPAR